MVSQGRGGSQGGYSTVGRGQGWVRVRAGEQSVPSAADGPGSGSGPGNSQYRRPRTGTGRGRGRGTVSTVGRGRARVRVGAGEQSVPSAGDGSGSGGQVPSGGARRPLSRPPSAGGDWRWRPRLDGTAAWGCRPVAVPVCGQFTTDPDRHL